MKNIVNIINFVRGCEPRAKSNEFLLYFEEQLVRLARETGLPSTFLLQYDAFTKTEFAELMKSCEDICELGVWFEMCQELIEKVGETWRGRYPWDWWNDVGFLIGYEPEVRLRIIDEVMDRFKETFGYYPKSVGSWHMDAVSMKYLAEKYEVKACCICRDQVGTDGYTMQGGYYNQAYYPSVNNMFCPAGSKETQINMPVFRMLGPDNIYAYDYQIMPYMINKMPTLEPGGIGASYGWCDWYFKETFNGAGLCFQYTQAGQENSMGWGSAVGLEHQYPYIKQLADEGKVEVMTLGDTGEWYQEHFALTPPGTITALSDWHRNRYKSVWYSSRNYRVNLLWDNGKVRFRDMYLFNDKFQEKYLTERCARTTCEYRNLPIMDGTLYSDVKNGILAGIYICDDEEVIKWDSLNYSEEDGKALVELCAADKHLTIIFEENEIQFVSNVEKLTLKPVYNENYLYGKRADTADVFKMDEGREADITYVSEISQEGNTIGFVFGGVRYGLETVCGTLAENGCILATDGKIVIVPRKEYN